MSSDRERGSFWLGFGIALLAGVFGIAGVHLLTSEGDVRTRSGARFGLVLGVALIAILLAHG